MTSTEPEPPRSVAEAIDVVEATYELMLAYAAQGRAAEDDDPLGVRRALQRADAALEVLAAARPEDMQAAPGAAAAATADMLAVLHQDIVKARAAFRFVLAQRSIGSQIIDNVNASIHVRALLTDLFLIDEALSSGSGT
jgi:hypothetical protein